MEKDYSHLVGKMAYKNHDGLFGRLVGEVVINDSGLGISPLAIKFSDGSRLGAFPQDLVIVKEGEY